jgi:hypothetical protein
VHRRIAHGIRAVDHERVIGDKKLADLVGFGLKAMRGRIEARWWGILAKKQTR